MARQYQIRPTKLYPAVLREIANLIEERRVEEVNLAALIEVAEYVRERHARAHGP
jgi:hypothetical protein